MGIEGNSSNYSCLVWTLLYFNSLMSVILHLKIHCFKFELPCTVRFTASLLDTPSTGKNRKRNEGCTTPPRNRNAVLLTPFWIPLWVCSAHGLPSLFVLQEQIRPSACTCFFWLWDAWYHWVSPGVEASCFPKGKATSRALLSVQVSYY